MALLRLNALLIDYVTVTSFSRKWYHQVVGMFRDEHVTPVAIKQRGYEGIMVPMESGTLKFLSGWVGSKKHYMMSASGEISDYIIRALVDVSRGEQVVCTRIDCQVTRYKDKRMSLTALRNRLEKNNKVGYPSPSVIDGVKMETVYIGKREKSDRFYRVYVKITKESKPLIRYEAELKKRRSRAIFWEWLVNGFSQDSLVAEMNVLADKDRIMSKYMNLNFSPDAKVVRVQTDDSRTERWIIRDVMPVIKKFICGHGNDATAVLASIYDALEAHEELNNEPID